MFRCCIEWVDSKQDRLLIGWGQTVHVLEITPPNSISRVPQCNILGMFEVDFYICGIAPYKDNLLMLAYDEDEEDKEKKKSPIPELRVSDMKGNEVLCDGLTVKDYQTHFATDYRLEFSAVDNVYYVLSQKDIIVAKPRDLDDHVKWLLEREKYSDALKCVKENENTIKMYNILTVGQSYLKHLMLKEKKYAEAAKLLPQVVGKDKNLWEKWIYEFMTLRRFGVF
jgi:hypothetical protein